MGLLLARHEMQGGFTAVGSLEHGLHIDRGASSHRRQQLKCHWPLTITIAYAILYADLLAQLRTAERLAGYY